MEWLFDPTIWVGLITLITLEVVLGIDNLVFIAILADRLPKGQRDKARVLGLLLALCLRLVLLSLMSWMITLNNPLISAGSVSFSGRDLIFIVGGFFLLFKATGELHERLEANPENDPLTPSHPKFWTVVLQIVVLDAVFSLDAVITAVGMVQSLPVMMAAVTVAIALMLLASKPLTSFVGKHPTVVVLCLGFLLMIGFSLVLEGFGLAIPKGYLYAAIGFSILIESFNQISLRNYLKIQAGRPMRARTADAVLRFMGEHHRKMEEDNEEDDEADPHEAAQEAVIVGEESNMITGVLTLSERSVRSLMTPRTEISWINLLAGKEAVHSQLMSNNHSLYPVCRGNNLDDVIGIAKGKDLMAAIYEESDLKDFDTLRDPVFAPESMDAVRLLNLLRKASGQMVMVADEFGSITGLITPVDVFEAIAGDFHADEHDPDIVEAEDHLLVQGGTDLHLLEQRLDINWLVDPDGAYSSLAGFLLDKFGHLPERGEKFAFNGLIFTVVEVSERRIDLVRISKEA